MLTPLLIVSYEADVCQLGINTLTYPLTHSLHGAESFLRS